MGINGDYCGFIVFVSRMKGDSVGAQDPPVTIGFDTKSWSNDLDKFGAHDLGNLHMTIDMFHFMNYSRGASNGFGMFGP